MSSHLNAPQLLANMRSREVRRARAAHARAKVYFVVAIALMFLALGRLALADTLVVDHPGWVETMDGRFGDGGLVMATSADGFGQLEFDAATRVCSPVDCGHMRPKAHHPMTVPGSAPWRVSVMYLGLESVDLLDCSAFLRYFDGYPTLTLTCEE